MLVGARQTGKTWLMKEFGKQAYADTIYINFDSNSMMANLFANDLDVNRLIVGLELYIGRKILRTTLQLRPGVIIHAITDEAARTKQYLTRAELKKFHLKST